MNTLKFLAALTLVAGSAVPIAVADVFSFTNNLPIPDGQPAGISDVEAVSASFSQIGSVQILLDIAGNFNGDLYCYLKHDSTLTVLLNRCGRTADNPFGYADSGFNIILSDSATDGNIHTYAGVVTLADGSPLTGIWQPDGRLTSPASVLATDPSTAGLSVLDSLDASGEWTLFIADLSPGGASVLNGWQLIINPVPEPSALVLEVLGLGLLSVCARKFRQKAKPGGAAASSGPMQNTRKS